MKRVIIVIILILTAVQIKSQSATTLIEILNPFLKLPAIPAASGNSVVFIDYRNYRYSMFMVDIITKQELLLIPVLGYTEPKLGFWAERIAWVGYPTLSQADLYVMNVATNVITRITEDPAFQNYPDIYENRLVWQDYRNMVNNNANADIYLYDFNTGILKQITTNNSYQSLPAIWGDLIVWEDHRNADIDSTNSDIYLYNLSTDQEIQITSNPAAQLNPDICENIIVWEDYRNQGNSDIYMFDFTTGIEEAVSTFNSYKSHPVVYGNWIVWLDYRNSPYADIYGYNLNTKKEYPIITQADHQDFVILDNLNLIWQDFRSYRQDLYRAVLINPQSAFLTINSPNGGENYSVGSTLTIIWNWNNVTDVKIEYSTDNGINWIDIVSSTPCTGSYPWTIPNTPSDLCKIRITDLSDQTVTDLSDGLFSIENPVSMQDSRNPELKDFELYQNYPNPFNPFTTIFYSLPHTSFIKIEIINFLGEKIFSVVDGFKDAGNHFETFDFEIHQSGIYFCTLQAEGFRKTIKMILLK
jgi:beta propeller repeat protein